LAGLAAGPTLAATDLVDFLVIRDDP